MESGAKEEAAPGTVNREVGGPGRVTVPWAAVGGWRLAPLTCVGEGLGCSNLVSCLEAGGGWGGAGAETSLLGENCVQSWGRRKLLGSLGGEGALTGPHSAAPGASGSGISDVSAETSSLGLGMWKRQKEGWRGRSGGAQRRLSPLPARLPRSRAGVACGKSVLSVKQSLRLLQMRVHLL